MGHYQDERAAIQDQFVTVWDEATSVFYENGPTAQGTELEYVTLSLLRGEAAIASLGSSPKRRYLGLVLVRIFVKGRTGNARADELLEIAESVFVDEDGIPRQLASGTNGLITFETPTPEVAGPVSGWYTQILRVPYYRDKTGQ